MSYSMSPFPLRFGSRQGGASAPAPLLTPDNAAQMLSDNGLTFTRSGAAPAGPTEAGLLYSAADGESALEWVSAYAAHGLLVRPAVTNLCEHGRDLTNAAWVKSNATPAKDQTGVYGDANGASSLAFTANNGTASYAITSAESARSTAVWIKRLSGTGQVDISQDNGSNWTEAELTAAWQRFAIPVATLTNPTLVIRGATSGDSIAVDVVGHHLAAGSAAYSYRPAAPSSSANAERCYRTLSAFPALIDLSVLVLIGRQSGTCSLLRLHEPGDFQGSIAILANEVGGLAAELVRNSTDGFAVSYIALGSVTEGDIVRVDLQYDTTSLYRARLDGGEWATATWLNIDLARDFDVGRGWTAGNESNSPILALQDNAKSILSRPYGWGHELFLA